MALILGVDGGNTKTIALVARPDGEIAGYGRGGRSDIYNATSVLAALGEIDAAVGAALAAAGATKDDLRAACFSLAGADWPEDFAFLHAAMTERGYGRMVRIVHDSIGGLRAGSPDGTGVGVVCGTGTAIGARAADGSLWHTSFWQESLDLGRHALLAVYRAELGIDPPTSLTERALAIFDCATVEDLLHRFTTRGVEHPPNEGAMVVALLDEAGRADATARRVVVDRARVAGEYALAAARRVGIERDPFTLVLAGGILRHRVPLFADAITAHVHDSAPWARPVRSRYEPAAGALFLAYETAGIAVDDGVLARLDASLPPPSLFVTR